ncbi:MAG: hypothetical protein VKP62_03580 [Candidatus Sericytochromatia bacterium]|nr:hypothetical protein [Candidatus Sericytochromatia bacterium]
MSRLPPVVWLLLAALSLAAAPAPQPDPLVLFVRAAVGQRLLALGHTPHAAVRLKTGEWAIAIHAPEQSSISAWDDESRIVLYRRTAHDFERVQFVSKAGRSVPGRLTALEVRDLDGDGVEELVARGQPHGPVGKQTVMVFRRSAPTAGFEVVLRRRQLALTMQPVATRGLRLQFEKPRGTLRREHYAWDGVGLKGEDTSLPPLVWE